MGVWNTPADGSYKGWWVWDKPSTWFQASDDSSFHFHPTRALPQGRLGIKACIIKIGRKHTFTPHGKLGSLLSSSTFNNITRRSSEYVQVVVNARLLLFIYIAHFLNKSQKQAPMKTPTLDIHLKTIKIPPPTFSPFPSPLLQLLWGPQTKQNKLVK